MQRKLEIQRMQIMQRLQIMHRLPRLLRSPKLPKLPIAETSQNLQKVDLFEKINEFFGKNLSFFKFAKAGKIAIECDSIGIIS